MKRRKWLLAVLALVAATLVFLWGSATDVLRPAFDNKPLVLAHRGGSGQWPQNSRTAVENAVAAGYQGIEIDVVLTKDDVLVLSHDPWVHDRLCTTTDGKPLTEHVLIKDKTLADLQAEFVCGGVPDEDFPEVEPVAETIMTLSEVFTEVSQKPEMALYLDVKIDPGLTATPEQYASAIRKLWAEQRLENRLFVEAPVDSYGELYRATSTASPMSVLSYPPFSVQEKAWWTVLKARWLTRLRIVRPQAEAAQASAQALASPTWVMTWPGAKAAREQGVQIILFTPNTEEDLHRYCAWPVDALITDYPKLGTCP